MENATELKAAAAAPAATSAGQTCSAGASGGGLNRRTLYIGVGIGAAAGLFLGWDWLVAIGAASLIIALAPCLIMCAFGICASRMGKDKKTEGTAKPDAVNADAPVTKTAADDVPVANTAAAVRPVKAGADDVLVTKTAVESAPNAAVPQART